MMHKQNLKILIAAGLTVFMLLMGGCSGMNDIQEKVDIRINENKDVFLNHLAEKYQVNFLPISYEMEGFVTNEEFRCYAEGMDRERDFVSVYRKDEDGQQVIYDNYFGIIVRDEYENRVKAICEPQVGTSKVFISGYAVSYFSNELTNAHTLDDAISMGEPMAASKYVYFEVTPDGNESFEAACDRVAAELQEQKLTGFICFVGLAAGELSNITEDNYLDYPPSLVKPDGTICLMLTTRFVSSL